MEEHLYSIEKNLLKVLELQALEVLYEGALCSYIYFIFMGLILEYGIASLDT